MAMKVLSETQDFAAGQAILQPVLPVLGRTFGPAWVAQHSAEDYLAGERFVDYCVSQPYRALTGWRHSHEMRDAAGETLVRDVVSARVSPKLLDRIFTFRTTRTRLDLALVTQQRRWNPAQLTIAVSGASGFVGTQLCALLTTCGHRIIRLTRGRVTNTSERFWLPEDPARDLLAGVDAVIHLAGESIAGRMTAARREAIAKSRWLPTRRLAELSAKSGVKTFVSASAIGYYGAHRSTVLTENSSLGTGFLSSVVDGWEDASRVAESAMRVVQVRTGLVLGAAGGLLGRLVPLFSAGLGGKLGHGKQWMSWISLDDLLDIYVRCLLDDEISGPVNAVAPYPVRNQDFTQTLAKTLSRKATLTVSPMGLRLAIGQRATQQLALADQFVSPEKLLKLGHRFRFPNLAIALSHELGRTVANKEETR